MVFRRGLHFNHLGGLCVIVPSTSSIHELNKSHRFNRLAYLRDRSFLFPSRLSAEHAFGVGVAHSRTHEWLQTLNISMQTLKSPGS